MLIEDDKLRGKKVLTSNGRQIGEVIAIEIEIDTWRVHWIDVKLMRDVLDDLKVKKPLLGAPIARIAPEHLRGVSDAVLLGFDTEQAAQLFSAQSGVEIKKT